MKKEDRWEHLVGCRMLPLMYVYLFGGATIGTLFAGTVGGVPIALFFTIPALCLTIGFAHLLNTICPHKEKS